MFFMAQLHNSITLTLTEPQSFRNHCMEGKKKKLHQDEMRVIAVCPQRHMEMNQLGKCLPIDFLLVFIGFMVMLGEISGSINF